MNKRLALGLFLVNSLVVFAQTKTEEFKAFKEKYSSKAFDYTEEPPKEIKEIEPSAFSEFLMKIIEFFVKLPWNIIFYFVVGLFLLFLAYRLYKNGGIFKRNAQRIFSETDFDYIEENLDKVNFDQLVIKAEKEQHYKLAIRFMHYQSLQNLDKNGHIVWDTKKTNQQFINQIKEEKIRFDFINLTSIFNQVWFGDFSIDVILYQEYKKMFHEFNQYF